eukprot:CAMPEP_0203888528 /NCGR_PEP_ID=MMETSP0359-20131031/32123_1 /ASSEMBLY_ACC=CAM_ASM_000338 /TAXON_ID=268821 /ORGANISM="Scrippsiella Hangoei, Strain SHTV-5" /LENGTH=655 /DNA_ID=CAMNT_0050809741 /DNA_START=50 /DNA_END=2013 /DNA_ORIENTATION=+
MDVEQASKKQRNRGKLYALTEDAKWQDQGTGIVTIVANGDGRRLVFQDEASGEVLHDRKVWPSETYHLQGEGEKQSIIVWEDPESQKDWALSFQDQADITGVWDAIRQDKRVLPDPTYKNLPDLARALAYVPPNQREALANECIAEGFLSGLRDAFHIAEDSGDEGALICLWRISKGIFLLSNQRLAERYLKPDSFEDILGMLEYDEGLPLDKRIAHRQVHTMQVQFNQAVPFEDSAVLERIHLIYRLQYVKDIVLPRLMDDSTFACMTHMVHSNLAVVLEHLQKDVRVLEALFVQIRQGDLQSLLFLQDACRLSKQVPPMQRQALYERIVALGLFEVLIPFLRDGVLEVVAPSRAGGEAPQACSLSQLRPLLRPRALALEILALATQSDPAPTRGYLCSEGGPGRELLRCLIRLVHEEVDQGLQGQAAELIRAAMDPTGLEGAARDQCLGTFYERGGFQDLVRPMRGSVDRLKSNASVAFGAQLACELLGFAVTHHGFKAKGFITRYGNLAEPLSQLVSSEQRFLQLAPLRLLRVMVSTADEIYIRFIQRSGLLAPVMRGLQRGLQPPTIGGGGAFISAALGLLDLIRSENARPLVEQLFRTHGAFLREHQSRFRVFDGIVKLFYKNLEDKARAAQPDPKPAAPPPSQASPPSS